MTNFSGRQRNEGRAVHRFGWWRRGGQIRMQGETEQKGVSEQDEGDVAIPAVETAAFMMIQTEGFAGVQVFFDVPTSPQGLNHEGERGSRRSPDEEVGQGSGCIEATTDEQEMATIDFTGQSDGQAGPVKSQLH